MRKLPLAEAIRQNQYPGTGIVAGLSSDGGSIITVFYSCAFGKEEKNRALVEDGGGVLLKSVNDLSDSEGGNVLYQPVLTFENKILMGNGAHTEQVFDLLTAGKSFTSAVKDLNCLDDAPLFTPRITGLADIVDGRPAFDMSVIRCAEADGSGIVRGSFSYRDVKPGSGFYIYGFSYGTTPDEAFTGEPIRIEMGISIFDVVADVWENLRADARVSMWARSVDISSHRAISRIINLAR